MKLTAMVWESISHWGLFLVPFDTVGWVTIESDTDGLPLQVMQDWSNRTQPDGLDQQISANH